MADEVISKGLGISDATAEEIDTALRIASEDELALTIYLGSLLNWRAHLGWATTGHSGTDVNLYYYEPSVGEKKKKKQSQKGESDVPTARSAAFSGNHENTWVGEWTASYLDLDLPSITRQLNNGSSYSWTAEHGSDLSQFTRELEHYHGSKAVMNAARVGRRAERGSQEVYGYSHRENDAIRRRSSVHGKSHAKAKRDHLDL